MKRVFLLFSLLLSFFSSYGVTCARNIYIRNTTSCPLYVTILMNNGTCGSGQISSAMFQILPGAVFSWWSCGSTPLPGSTIPITTQIVELVKIETGVSSSCPDIGMAVGDPACGLSTTGSFNTPQNPGCSFSQCPVVNASFATTFYAGGVCYTVVQIY